MIATWCIVPGCTVVPSFFSSVDVAAPAPSPDDHSIGAFADNGAQAHHRAFLFGEQAGQYR